MYILKQKDSRVCIICSMYRVSGISQVHCTSFSSQIGRSGWEVSLLHFPSFPAVTWRLREKSGQKRYPYLDMSLTHACNLGWLPYMFVVLACGEPTYMIVLISHTPYIAGFGICKGTCASVHGNLSKNSS